MKKMKFECNGKAENSSEISGDELTCAKGCTNCVDDCCGCKCHQKDSDGVISEV